MGRAVVCPICNGTGKVKPTISYNDDKGQICHGCSGKGWVEVSDY